tara:strand:+ start:224 stop:409 length:186 start_codon:yes stop_codon:yes gene_type:complete
MSKKKEKKVTTYKAVNPKQFSEWYNEKTPFYDELSKGESLELDIAKKPFNNFLKTNIIKEG